MQRRMAPSSPGRQVVACHDGPGLPSWCEYLYVLMRLGKLSDVNWGMEEFQMLTGSCLRQTDCTDCAKAADSTTSIEATNSIELLTGIYRTPVEQLFCRGFSGGVRYPLSVPHTAIEFGSFETPTMKSSEPC